MNYRKNENENLCIVPARKGSKGIKNKNIVLLKKVPLVEHTLKFAKKIKNKFDIVLSSDSKKILKIGRKYNFICDEIRPKKLFNPYNPVAIY